MLRITMNSNPESAVKYHDSSLSRSDYYSRHDEKTIGLWGGHGATRLGLTGEVKKEDFHALCFNINPNDQKRLTARTDANRTIGYDHTFSVPKSVSIQFAMTKDQDIKTALDIAVKTTMQEIEMNGAETRVRKNGKNENRTTGNLIWAAFTHNESRPVNGIPDCHLHTHCFVFNATWDETEAKWKAGNFRGIKTEAPYYETLFHNHLAYELQKAGYKIERNERDFEIAGYKRSTIEKYSNRTLEVEKKIKEKGLEYAEDKAKVGAQTRSSKKNIEKKGLQKEWLSRLDAEELKVIREAKNKSRSETGTDRNDEAKKAIDHAIEHGLERKSVIAHNELMIEALKFSMGSTCKEELEGEIKNRKELLSKEINNKRIYTHTKAIQEEKKLIDASRSGRGQFKPINSTYVSKNKELNQEQTEVVKHTLQSKDGIIIITGGAGTGKTTTVKEIATAITEKGISFHAFAPSSSASREVLQQEGFNATTMAELLINKKLQEQCKGGVIWIDEAGLVGVPGMNDLIIVAKEQKARLLLTGDTRQHTGVQRGDALRIIQKYGGIKPKYINQIQRQKKEVYKEAVKAISEGRIKNGYDLLNQMGAIKESGSLNEAVNKLAQEYIQAQKSKESILVVAPTHKQGQAITLSIREGLKKDGRLGKKDQVFPVQINLGYTEAQKKDKSNYEVGQNVQFHQNLNGIIRGQVYDVIGKDDKGNVIINYKGHKKILPLQEAKKFSVYKTEKIGLAKGDLIRINQNGFSINKKRINNGNVLQVKGFDEKGNIVALTAANNEVVIDKEYRNYSHGYYSTSISAQSKSVNRVLILQTSHTGKAASKEQWYVSVSRGKFEISIHTDDKEHLLESIQRTSVRMSAIEMISPLKERNRVQNIKDKLTRIGETTRSRVIEIKDALRTYIHSPNIQRSAPSRSR